MAARYSTMAARYFCCLDASLPFSKCSRFTTSGSRLQPDTRIDTTPRATNKEGGARNFTSTSPSRAGLLIGQGRQRAARFRSVGEIGIDRKRLLERLARFRDVALLGVGHAKVEVIHRPPGRAPHGLLESRHRQRVHFLLVVDPPQGVVDFGEVR